MVSQFARSSALASTMPPLPCQAATMSHVAGAWGAGKLQLAQKAKAQLPQVTAPPLADGLHRITALHLFWE